jgi:hypothetical protein
MNNVTTFIPLIITLCAIGFFMLNGVPKLQEKIAAERQVYKDAKEAVERAKQEENQLKLQALKAYQENIGFTSFNANWSNIANTLGRPEDVSRLITREAQTLGLKISNSRLEDPIEFNTLEGSVAARPFIVSVEGSHQQIGQWIVRVENLLRTVRVANTSWFPFGTEVQADVTFQLMDDDRLFASGEAGLTLPAWLQAGSSGGGAPAGAPAGEAKPENETKEEKE